MTGRPLKLIRRETRAGRSWRGLAAAVETWMEGSVLRAHTHTERAPESIQCPSRRW